MISSSTSEFRRLRKVAYLYIDDMNIGELRDMVAHLIAHQRERKPINRERPFAFMSEQDTKPQTD
jgi:hypothetical protein